MSKGTRSKIKAKEAAARERNRERIHEETSEHSSLDDYEDVPSDFDNDTSRMEEEDDDNNNGVSMTMNDFIKIYLKDREEREKHDKEVDKTLAEVTKFMGRDNNPENKPTGTPEKTPPFKKNFDPEAFSEKYNFGTGRSNASNPKVKKFEESRPRIFKTTPAEDGLLKLIQDVKPNLIPLEDAEKSCIMEVGGPGSNYDASRPRIIDSDPRNMTIDERVTWLMSAQQFCTCNRFRTDQWVYMILVESVKHEPTADGIDGLIGNRVGGGHSYVVGCWKALLLYFFADERELYRYLLKKCQRLSNVIIRKNTSVNATLIEWAEKWRGIHKFKLNFTQGLYIIRDILYDLVPQTTFDFQHVQNWGHLADFLREVNIGVIPSPAEDYVWSKPDDVDVLVGKPSQVIQFNQMANSDDTECEVEGEPNVIKYNNGKNNGNYQRGYNGQGSRNSHNSGGKNNGKNNGNYQRGHNGQGSRNSYNSGGKNNGNYQRGYNGQGSRNSHNSGGKNNGNYQRGHNGQGSRNSHNSGGKNNGNYQRGHNGQGSRNSHNSGGKNNGKNNGNYQRGHNGYGNGNSYNRNSYGYNGGNGNNYSQSTFPSGTHEQHNGIHLGCYCHYCSHAKQDAIKWLLMLAKQERSRKEVNLVDINENKTPTNQKLYYLEEVISEIMSEDGNEYNPVIRRMKEDAGLATDPDLLDVEVIEARNSTSH